MAYSNYGAYVWKNGVDFTEEQCDTTYYYQKNKWHHVHKNEEHEFFDSALHEKVRHIGSHAVIQINNSTIIEFYKTCFVNIHYKNGTKQVDIENDILNSAEYKYRNIKIIGYPLDKDDSIIFYEITYRQDVYCVIVGSNFGNGYDDKRISKYIKKHIEYDDSDNKRRFYHIPTKSQYQLDYLCMRDQLDFEKYLFFTYSFKPFLKALFTFRWNQLSYYFGEIKQALIDMYYLKGGI